MHTDLTTAAYNDMTFHLGCIHLQNVTSLTGVLGTDLRIFVLRSYGGVD